MKNTAMAVQMAFATVALAGCNWANTYLPSLPHQPPVELKVKAPTATPAGTSSLLAYVSPARYRSWAVEGALTETMKRVNQATSSVSVVSAEELAAIASRLEPIEGDQRYWADAACATDAVSCTTDYVSLGRGTYRHATTVNTTACAYSFGGTCWDTFGTRCLIRYYSDSACSHSIPSEPGYYNDWVCGPARD